MRYNLFSYLVGERFSNAIKNKKTTWSCLLSMMGAMILFGLFYALMLNTNLYLEKVESDQGISVYILDEATQEDTDELEKKIRSIDGVQNVIYKSKEEALETVKEQLGDNEYIVETYKSRNPFPASFTVTFNDLTKNKEIQEQIAQFDYVKEITSSDSTMEVLVKIVNGFKRFFIVFSIILVFTSIVMINNVVKLSIVNRGKEIEIMKYVGATNSFIRWPFIVEGMLIGLVAAILSLGIMAIVYTLVANSLSGNVILVNLGFNLISFTEIMKYLVAIYIILGMGIGVIGSSASMRKYLKV